MPLVNPLDDPALDAHLLEKLQFFKGPLGVIPNSVRTMARRPAIAESFTQLNIAVMECHGAVTPELKRLLGFVTSANTGCRYCQAHTALGAQRFGASDERVDAVWSFRDSDAFDAAEKVALEFALAASAVPNAVDDDLAQRLHAHWSDDDIVEMLGVIALFGFLNRWNDSMGTTLESLPLETAQRHLAAHGWRRGKHA